MSDREKIAELVGECEWWCTSENIADHLIANGVTVQQWISVTERLPEGGELVLVGDYRDGWVDRARFLPNGRWYVRTGFLDSDEVTHWMPLPEPPKEGE